MILVIISWIVTIAFIYAAGLSFERQYLMRYFESIENKEYHYYVKEMPFYKVVSMAIIEDVGMFVMYATKSLILIVGITFFIFLFNSSMSYGIYANFSTLAPIMFFGYIIGGGMARETYARALRSIGLKI